MENEFILYARHQWTRMRIVIAHGTLSGVGICLNDTRINNLQAFGVSIRQTMGRPSNSWIVDSLLKSPLPSDIPMTFAQFASHMTQINAFLGTQFSMFGRDKWEALLRLSLQHVGESLSRHSIIKLEAFAFFLCRSFIKTSWDVMRIKSFARLPNKGLDWCKLFEIFSQARLDWSLTRCWWLESSERFGWREWIH